MISVHTRDTTNQFVKIDFTTELTFTGGEVHIGLPSSRIYYDKTHVIKAQITSSEDVMKLLLVTDALRRLGCRIIHLELLYVPYARQDRVCNEGEAHSLKVFAGLINNLKFEQVTVFDPHSDVTEALFDNVKIIKNHFFVEKALENLNMQHYKQGFFYLVSPDAGASKKIQELAKYLMETNKFRFEIIQCGKVRDTATGKLTGFSVDATNLNNTPCIIVDDICARGGTFLGLAQKLVDKNAGNISLVVSHYEDVADRQAFKNVGINKIICSNSFKDISGCNVVNQIKIF